MFPQFLQYRPGDGLSADHINHINSWLHALMTMHAEDPLQLVRQAGGSFQIRIDEQALASDLLPGGGTSPAASCISLDSSGHIVIDQTVTLTVPVGGVVTVSRKHAKPCFIIDTYTQPVVNLNYNACGMLVSATPGSTKTTTLVLDECDCDCDTPTTPCDTVCECSECPCGAPCFYVLGYPGGATSTEPFGSLTCGGSTVDFSSFNHDLIPLAWDSGCTWQSASPFAGITLSKLSTWTATFTNGGKTLFYPLISSGKGEGEFDCCGENLFGFDSGLSGCTFDATAAPFYITVTPASDCGPCPDECVCEDGDCSECDNPPAEWLVPVGDAFTGSCAVFNGDWTLLQDEAECQWVHTFGTVTISITIDAGFVYLAFEDTATGAHATFTVPFSGTNCCTPLLLSAYGDCTCPGGGGDTGGCVQCTSTPESWLVFISTCTGDLAALNGTWEFEYIGGCVWKGIGADLRLGIGAAGAVSLQMETATGQGATYDGTVTASDCCSAVTMTRGIYVNGATGTAPATLTLTPSCASSGDNGTCPDELIAVPVCCPSETHEGDCTDCSLCPEAVGGSPDRWLLTATGGLTNRCCFLSDNDGPLDLARTTDGDCLWRQENDSRIVTLFPFMGTWFVKCVQVGGGAILVYRLDAFGFRCCGPNRFTLDVDASSLPKGCDAPPSLLLTPPPEGCPCSTDSGTETVDVDCCPSDHLPTTLHISGGTGNGTTLTWDGSTYWTGSNGGTDWRFSCPSAGLAPCDPCSTLRLEYNSGAGWVICGCASDENGCCACSCNPLSKTFSVCGTVQESA